MADLLPDCCPEGCRPFVQGNATDSVRSTRADLPRAVCFRRENPISLSLFRPAGHTRRRRSSDAKLRSVRGLRAIPAGAVESAGPRRRWPVRAVTWILPIANASGWPGPRRVYRRGLRATAVSLPAAGRLRRLLIFAEAELGLGPTASSGSAKIRRLRPKARFFCGAGQLFTVASTIRLNIGSVAYPLDTASLPAAKLR